MRVTRMVRIAQPATSKPYNLITYDNVVCPTCKPHALVCVVHAFLVKSHALPLATCPTVRRRGQARFLSSELDFATVVLYCRFAHNDKQTDPHPRRQLREERQGGKQNTGAYLGVHFRSQSKVAATQAGRTQATQSSGPRFTISLKRSHLTAR